MNLGDPELELVDPTPNVHSLFIHFDKLFFWTKLASRAVVRWSKRMYSCAGICSYDRGGLCDIALSEPLLKLRPRKDLVETLLHEMIHAYLFITNSDRDRDGHGPNFQAHMHRINNAAGLNISIYHDFHDEVKLYQTHWWRCNGPCQSLKPYFGIVRRSYNRAPGPNDFWWGHHRQTCGGTFVKIKEPENIRKKMVPAKSNGNITKFINNPKSINNIVPTKPILKDSNSIPVKTKSNGGGTVVITKKEPVFNPTFVTKQPPIAFTGTGQVIDANRQRSSFVSVVEAVRNVWVNKNLPQTPKLPESPNERVRSVWANKKLPKSPNAVVTKNKPKGINKSLSINTFNLKRPNDSTVTSPPLKMKKIDDYFNKTSAMLKDVYGQDFTVTQTDNKIIAVVTNTDTQTVKAEASSKTIPKTNVTDKSYTKTVAITFVDCPVCEDRVQSDYINRHLDECLNKEVINSVKGEERIISQSPPVKFNRNKVVVNASDNANNNVPKYIDVDHELSLAIAKVENQIPDDEYKICNDLNEAKELLLNLKYEQPSLEKGDKSIIKIVPGTSKNSEKSNIKSVSGTSKDSVEFVGQMCACCGAEISTSIEEHLEECLAFFTNNDSIPDEGASTSFANETLLIDDDEDILDESLILNDTGTKSPCPCCLKMIENAEMNDHLDMCLS